MTPDVRLVMVESPTNPRLRCAAPELPRVALTRCSITDIRAVAAAAKAVGALVCVVRAPPARARVL